MRYVSSFLQKFVVPALLFLCFSSKAQILTYTTDTGGVLNAVAGFATGTNLVRVNGAAEPSSICSAGGYTVNQFTAATSYSATLPAVELSVTPNSGYTLNVTGFSAALRRNTTGPDSVMFAYSLDGGTTWLSQGISQVPRTGGCGATSTSAWVISFPVTSPSTLKLRVYGFSATDTGGVLQLMNVVVNGTVTLTAGCTEPAGLYASGISGTGATLNWVYVSGSSGYSAQYRQVGTTTWTTVPASTTSVNITGLSCGTTYEYQVQTLCLDAGASSFTPSSTFSTTYCSCPNPSGLTATSLSSTSEKFSWTPITGASGYNLRYRMIGVTTWTTTATTADSLVVPSISCGTPYEFQVQTICSTTGAGPWSASDTFSTTACACPTPTGLNITGLTSSAATMNWVPVVGALSYDVWYRADGSSIWIDSSTTASHVSLAGAVCNQPYVFMVRAICSVTSTGAFSAVDSFSTDTCLCPNATGLSVSAITTMTATLSWTSDIYAAYYNYRYRQLGTTVWISDSSHTTSKTISGLNCGTSYEFQVQTICGGLGAGSFGASHGFTTAVCPASASSGTMAIYFNHPVDNSVSYGVNAKYLNSCMADTLAAYIGRAKYSIDIALTDYEQTSSFDSICNAINAAYLSGIKVRWIYDAGHSNSGLSLIAAGIPTLASPTTSAYGTMHNKFMVIDGRSTNANDAIVSVGSGDWTFQDLDSSYNNTMFIQDSALANAYLAEFNLMWGDTGALPNSTASLFGTFKSNLGRHLFDIGGKMVELYFSPSDGTDTHIASSIASANTDLYFGMYNLAEAAEAASLASAKVGGVYTLGIVDHASTTGTAYPTLTSVLGSNMITYASATSAYNNKFLVVDPSNFCSDPQVLTGSQDWTTAGNTLNDENTLIVHNDTVANLYYQAFVGNYTALGGSASPITNCALYTHNTQTLGLQDGDSFEAYPNPAGEVLNLAYTLSADASTSLSIYNMVGQRVAVVAAEEVQATGTHHYAVALGAPGIYFAHLTIGNVGFTKKVVKLQ